MSDSEFSFESALRITGLRDSGPENHSFCKLVFFCSITIQERRDMDTDWSFHQGQDVAAFGPQTTFKTKESYQLLKESSLGTVYKNIINLILFTPTG